MECFKFGQWARRNTVGTGHGMYVAPLLSWGLWNAGSAGGGKTHHLSVFCIVLCCLWLVIWEIIPTMLILVTIATPQGHRSSSYSARENRPGGGSRYGSDGGSSRGVNGSGGRGRGNESLLSDGRGGWTMKGGTSGPGGEGLWSSSQHGGQQDDIESAKRWLEGGDLFEGKLLSCCELFGTFFFPNH